MALFLHILHLNYMQNRYHECADECVCMDAGARIWGMASDNRDVFFKKIKK